MKQKKKITWETLYKWTSNYGMSFTLPLVWITIILLSFSAVTILEWIVIKNTIKIKGKFLENGPIAHILSAIYYNICDTFFVNQPFVAVTGFLTVTLAKIKTALVSMLFILSGFAVRRKFRT
ncbi:MAG: hypothetical protein GY754_47340 [bacterium]|nr:hypothetical protein [bacterium]